MKTRKTTKTIELIVERREFFTAQKSRRTVFVWCAECDGRTPMLTPDEAARAAGVSERTIYCWVEAGRLHFLDTPAGDLFVCLAALTERNKK